ncbi:tetratricopeptide repeat protein [Agriterribacter sp.]|uniref:type IX secretion system periplasmic lipoprotein PorW/SprE n=1 Tax=Agriterribacter sp. TaxID=2821509 RepID=UPI002BBC9435|nr:tetratricopeptide repeat protein [Agriterribacter sp.]HTN08926.1 tetratricopeptide repeat protein [Agriterribacter sp.]
MAQKDATLDVKKPEKYDNRILGSDKTFTTKYTIPRRLMQGMSTHYNFFFNANVKLTEVVAGAKQGFQEDYTELLPFYNYTLDATAAQKTELDSVIQKCNAGILLHDLRNEWIDDMYFLMGKAYFFKKQFDSAYIAFQYLNYYFQPKTDEELGFKKYIGSNLNDEGNVYSVSTKEKTGITSKIFTEPPRRNDALVWQLRNYIEDSSYNAASAMIQTLRRDELFPRRLKPALEEAHAYLFYKNKVWDSAAHYLVPALDNAENMAERARWEYLIGQLYALSKKTTEAGIFFDRSIKHTIDPVMEVYARLNKIKLAQGGNEEKIIDENIKQLLKMARRDKYYNYRNIIYYMAAQMEMQRNNFDAAKTWLLKSVQYNKENLDQRNRSFLYLGNLAFEKKEYEPASGAYDSLDINSPVVKDAGMISMRKDALNGVVTKLRTIRLEDSLQKVAAMPEDEREKYVKAAARRLRKERGLKENDLLNINTNNPFANSSGADIFSGNEGKGDWYFNNNGLKSKGFTAFRNNWGSRPNVDNWRRMADVAAQFKTPEPANDRSPDGMANAADHPEDISFDGLMKNLPLTPEAAQVSNDSIQSALFGLGKAFKDQFEDYAEAIKNYETLLNRFPDTRYREEAVFDLYYCYTKLNMPVKAKQYREILGKVAPQSPYIEYIDNPKAVAERKTKLKDDATRNYEKIYDLFLEGKFEEAIIQKAKADSIYGNIYWPQQLLYIESIYYIKQRDDNSAINALQHLIQINPEAPISKKAEHIMDVLKRRDEIEKYLTNLDIERAKEDSVAVMEEKPRTGVQEQVKASGQPKAQEVAAAKEKIIKPAIDSSVFNRPKPAPQSGFSYHPAEEHYVAVVLHKVDIVFGNEAKNAFNRYNRESFNDQQIEITILPLDEDNKLMLMSGFSDAVSALDYVNKAKRVAGAQVIPWLAAGKYSFIVISTGNLKVLENNKDLEGYRQFVEANYPAQ